MIRLTIHTPSGPEIHLFKKNIITIGKETSGADLIISEEGLQPIFLNIVQQNDFPIVINLANDPFISLNGHPFGRKLLNHGDVLLVRDTEILFENLSSPEEPTPNETPSKSILNIELPFENEVEAFKEGEWHPSSLEQLAISQEDFPVSLSTETPSDPPPIKKNRIKIGKNLVIFSLLFLFIIVIVIGSHSYLLQREFSKDQERMAARGISDIAMALTHAKLNHLKPNNQNWYDADFFKSNLKAVVGDQPTYAENIDLHGNFSCCPYTLRTYTNQDLSRFLLIAQPEPDFWQWLIPNSVILIDSESMDLRTLADLRLLNRLLANYHALDDANGKEISRLIKESPVFPLRTLCENNEQKDFSMPTPKTSLQEGCDQLIYNAPRYYNLCQPFIQKSKLLLNNAQSARELSAIKHEVETLSALPQLIIYSKSGKQEALELKKCLDSFCPTDSLSIGFVELSPQGHVLHSELLSENEGALALAETGFSSESVVDLSHRELNKHPFYHQFINLVAEREKKLEEKSKEIQFLLQQEIKSPQKIFPELLDTAIKHFYALNTHYELAIKKMIVNLTNSPNKPSLTDVLLFVKSANFEAFIPDESSTNLLKEKQQPLLSQIDSATRFTELKNLMENYQAFRGVVNEDENNRQIEDNQKNEIRNRLLNRVYFLLLSSEGRLLVDQINVEEIASLKNILNNEEFIYPHEKIFFIKELEYALGA